MQDSLERFGAYNKSMELFDLVVSDMDKLQEKPQCHRLISQQVASSDSICANIEEGYGRESSKEYIQFLRIARGSARETRGRYVRMKHWLPQPIIEDRIRPCDEIISILNATINTLRKQNQAK
jgi:four helix bundle protein